MAFRSLSRTGKIVVAAGAAGVAGTLVAFYFYPVHKFMYLNIRNIPRANGLMIGLCEKGWKTLQENEDCNSLLKKHLTKNVLDKLKTRKTVLGGTLWHVMQSGVANADAAVGVYAPDYDSYTTFRELLDPIIEDYHSFGPKDKQPPVDLGEGKLGELAPLDPDRKYIQSTRIRCGRSIRDFPFNTLMTEDDYYILEQKAKLAFETIKDPELKGTYYPLSGLDNETRDQLVKDHFLFKDNDKHLNAANATQYWPIGRGIYHNNSKTFVVWIGEEDHMRIISMQSGGDVRTVLDRFIRGLKSLEEKVPFARHSRLGWYTYCPTNLGSGIRASVHIRLPKVSARKDFKEICENLNLQVRGIHGEHSEAEGGIYDISNKRRLGISEFDAVKQMYDGVRTLIELEESDVKGKL